MWPQKWNASARCDFSAAATTLPPDAASSNRPTRERKPRRELLPRIASLSPASGMSGVQPALGRREQALELQQRVERALRQHDPGRIDDDAVGAARDRELLPEPRFLLLVEDLHLDVRIRPDQPHRGLERLAQGAAGGAEYGEAEPAGA